MRGQGVGAWGCGDVGVWGYAKPPGSSKEPFRTVTAPPPRDLSESPARTLDLIKAAAARSLVPVRVWFLSLDC